MVVVALGLILAAAVVGVLVFLAGRTHHGSPPLPQAPPKPKSHQVIPCDSCAHDYNPDALSGPKNQHPEQTGFAIDGNRNTAWSTESYVGDNLGKPGVGIYVDVKPGVAAGSMVLDTDTPGYAVTIYATHLAPRSRHVQLRARRLGQGRRRAERQADPDDQAQLGHDEVPLLPRLDHQPRRHSHVDVNEIALYTAA